MNFYYHNYQGKHIITLKKACPKWINSDTPDIYDQDGNLILKMNLGGVDFDQDLRDQLVKFIEASDKAFSRKYPDLNCVKNPPVKTFLQSWTEEIKNS